MRSWGLPKWRSQPRGRVSRLKRTGINCRGAGEAGGDEGEKINTSILSRQSPIPNPQVTID
ncbi:hypothetical protein [Dendronalium sp. ChiSLP03b]|uniref:hypothetical protein n=1 Tax=Dendronalium sp. ChiSLP03b TaxID=3075381 RepID=UPI00391D60AD